MYIPLIIILIILSFFSFWEKLWNYLIHYKKYISFFLYTLSLASFLILASDISMHNTWEYSIWLLWIILWIPVLAKVFDLVIFKKLMLFRKEIGIFMWVMAIVHSAQYFIEPYNVWFWELEFWYNNWITYLAWWMLALIISIILAITSNNFSIKKMGKSWKVLHRTAYVLLIFWLLHTASVKITYSIPWEKDIILTYLTTFIPFILYFIWKILEWKWIKINLKNLLNRTNNKTN